MTLLWSGHGETGADLRRWGRLQGCRVRWGRALWSSWHKARGGNCKGTTEHMEGGGGAEFSPWLQGRVHQQGQEARAIQEVMDPTHM